MQSQRAMNFQRYLALMATAALVVFLSACRGDEPRTADDRRTAQTELTAFELEHGIGPFTEEVEVGPIDHDLAEQGRDIFEMNCEVCHRAETSFVGPALGDVTERRSPTFILNMIMNPEEMVQRHPEGQAMLAEFRGTVMPYQNVTEEQARAILEYLRTLPD